MDSSPAPATSSSASDTSQQSPRAEFVCYYCDCSIRSKGRILSHVRRDHPGERIVWRESKSASVVKGSKQYDRKPTEKKNVKGGKRKRGRPFKHSSPLMRSSPRGLQPKVEKSAEFWTRFSDWYQSDGEGKCYLPWMEEEKQAVVKYFGHFIRSGTVPMCADIDAVRQRDPVLSGRTYLQIWSFIRSQSTSMRKKDDLHETLTYGCPDCCYTTASRFHFSLHLALHATQQDNLRLVRASEAHPRCGICGYFATSPADFESHVTQHSLEKSFLCATCWRDFDQAAEVLAHCRHQHPAQASKALERGALYRQLAQDSQMAVSLDPRVCLSRADCGDRLNPRAGGTRSFKTSKTSRRFNYGRQVGRKVAAGCFQKMNLSKEPQSLFKQETLQENLYLADSKPRFYRKVDLSGNISIRSVREVELSDISFSSEPKVELPDFSTRADGEVDLPYSLTKSDEEEDLPDLLTRSDEDVDLPDVLTRPDEEEEDLPDPTTKSDEDVDLPDVSTKSDEEEELPNPTTKSDEDVDLPDISTRSDQEEDLPDLSTRSDEDVDLPDILNTSDQEPFQSAFSVRSFKDVSLSDISNMSDREVALLDSLTSSDQEVDQADLSDRSDEEIDRSETLTMSDREASDLPTWSDQEVDISDNSARSDEEEDISESSLMSDRKASDIPTWYQNIGLSGIIPPRLNRKVGLSYCIPIRTERETGLADRIQTRLDRDILTRHDEKENRPDCVPTRSERGVCLCDYLPYANNLQDCRYNNCSRVDDNIYSEEMYIQPNEVKHEKPDEGKTYRELVAEKGLKLGDILADALKKIKQEKYKMCQ